MASALVAVTATAVLTANAYFGLVPDLRAVRRQVEEIAGRPVDYRTTQGGRVQVVEVPGDTALAVPASRAWVYTPPGYDPARSSYPVVYLVHGYPGGPADWFTLGRADRIVDELIRTGTMAPAVVVAPDVNGGGVRDGECLDAAGGPQVEQWLYSVLVPFVDGGWATRPDPAHRVLGGMSAGGFCALDQGLRHPQVWGAIITLEGYGDPGQDAARALGLDRAALRARSPSVYISSLDPAGAVPVFVGAAERSDPAAARAVADSLRARRFDVTLRVEPGLGHTWAAARAGVPFGLAFTTQALGW